VPVRAILKKHLKGNKGSTTLHLIENTFDRKRIYANPSSYPNPNSNSNRNTNPNRNSNPNPKAQLCFRTDEMTSFFDQVYRYRKQGFDYSNRFYFML